MKRYLIIAATIAWFPMIYFVAYFGEFDLWDMKATQLITTLLFAASLISCIVAIFNKETILGKHGQDSFSKID